MKKIIQNLFNFIVAIILMISTSGMTIYKLHCNCLHHNHISILVEPEGCHSHNHHVCSNPKDCELVHHTHNKCETSCDSKEALFVQLKTEFINTNSNYQDKIADIKCVELILPIILNIEIENSKREINSKCLESPPPKFYSGKEIITNYHQFKFDHIA